jgi:hypothetical protein
MARFVGLAVAVFVGALLGLTIAFATVATQKPDAKQENMEVSADVRDAGGDVSRVVLRYGNR